MASVEKDLQLRSNLLACELAEDMNLLTSIQAEKQLLLNQLHEHLSKAALQEFDELRSLGSPNSRHVPGRRDQDKNLMMTSPASTTDNKSGPTSDTPQVIARLSSISHHEMLKRTLSPNSCDKECANASPDAYGEISNQNINKSPRNGSAFPNEIMIAETLKGNSFSSNVVAKAFSRGTSNISSPPKKLKNEPARLLNTEVDVGRRLQMYLFRLANLLLIFQRSV